jgi:hypothetical protein
METQQTYSYNNGQQKDRKLALLDYEKIFSDSSARFAKAKESGFNGSPGSETADQYWAIVFNPENILTDRLIPGAIEQLKELQALGWDIIILTSIPYRCHAAVEYNLFTAWGLPDGLDLVMKPNALQKNRTATWRANQVAALGTSFNDILVVDSDFQNLDVVMAHNQLKWRVGRGLQLKTAHSLQAALKLLKEEAAALAAVQAETEETEVLEPEDIPFDQQPVISP